MAGTDAETSNAATHSAVGTGPVETVLLMRHSTPDQGVRKVATRWRLTLVVVFAVQVIFCAILVLGGAALLLIGFRGLRKQLPINRFFGVRTEAALRSDEAFERANQAAAPALLAAGGVGVLAGASLPVLASTFSIVLVTVLGVIGVFLLTGAGGVVGDRVAEAVPAPTPAGGCGGCAGGCCGA